MHILISAKSYPSKKNQLTAFVAVLAEEMVRQGVEVTILTTQSLTTCWRHKIPLCWPKSKVMVNTHEGVREMTILRPFTITLGQGRFGRLSQLIDRFTKDMVARMLKCKPDLIYSHFWIAADQIIDYAIRNDIPTFVASGEDEIDIENYIGPQRIARLRKHTRGVICVSTKNRTESIMHQLTDDSKCIVLPNAVNEKLFYHAGKKEARKALGYSQDDFIVAYCGRFNKRKGCRRVSEAITLLNNPSIKSIFIGVPAGADVEEPSCEGILFKGALPHEDIPIYLNASDVFVLPTLAEGCSNAIVEAMACGLPVISSDLPFNTDILDDKNAILVDPMNVKQIAEGINELLINPELRQQMSIATLAIMKELTIENRVRAILQFITSRNKKLGGGN